jgi:hypothetical protein
MTIQLIKSGLPVLTAKSAHRQGCSSDILPITYEGDVSLISPPLKTATVNMLESVFSLIARKHGFEMGGDYENVMIKHNLRP